MFHVFRQAYRFVGLLAYFIANSLEKCLIFKIDIPQRQCYNIETEIPE